MASPPEPAGPIGRARRAKTSAWWAISRQHFFVRYRSFESWAHLNQLAEHWLAEEADQRVHGTVKEVVAERFAREYPLLKALPRQRYDTSYLEYRQVGWDGYIDVRGNRYSVPTELAGQTVSVRIGLDDEMRVYHGREAGCQASSAQRRAGLGYHARTSCRLVAEHAERGTAPAGGL